MQRCVLIGMNSFVMTIVTVELRRRRRRRRPRTRARYRCLGCRPGTGVMWNILGNFIDFRSEASPTVKPRNVGLFPHSTNDTSPPTTMAVGKSHLLSSSFQSTSRNINASSSSIRERERERERGSALYPRAFTIRAHLVHHAPLRRPLTRATIIIPSIAHLSAHTTILQDDEALRYRPSSVGRSKIARG
jgi:hypothetical protein